MALSSTKLYQFLVARGFPDGKIMLRDADFSLPDKDYIARFGKRFSTFLWDNQMVYGNERWDCDNYASIATALMKMDHGRHFKGETELAVGVVCIATETFLHALVGAVHLEGGSNLTLRLYEPQPEGAKCLNEFPLAVQSYLSCVF